MSLKSRKPSKPQIPPKQGGALSWSASLVLLGACCLSLVLYLLAHRAAVQQIIAWVTGR